MISETEAMTLAEELGIHRFEIATPFAVGAVNVYLLEGTPLTLVDTGPNLGTSLVELERRLASVGRRLEDVELVAITHPHVDHLGLTGLVAARSGADVASLAVAADAIEKFPEWSAKNDDYASGLMLDHGVERHVVQALRTTSSIVRALGAPATVSRPLEPATQLQAGERSLHVLARSGHSPADTVFHDEAGRVLISGDHLLSEISSNALITRPLAPDWDGMRPRPLIDYRTALRATQSLDVQLVLGGHGPVITDHRGLIEQRLRRQDERADHLLELLSSGPLSAHDLAVEMWGRVAFTETFLTLSEVLGHLDVLIEDGSVHEIRGDVVRFATD